MTKKKDHKEHHDDAAAAAAAEPVVTDSVEDSGAVPEAPVGEAAEEGPDAENLAGELKAANERYLRLMAEFDNYKKRTSREYHRMIESATEKIISSMLDVRNTFELAIKHGETSSDYQKLFDGVKLIFTKFDGVLSSHGLTAFAEIGDEFDPQIHDALMKMAHETVPEDHIADIYEKGYRLNDRVIKHARVIVSSGKPEVAEPAQEQAAD